MPMPTQAKPGLGERMNLFSQFAFEFPGADHAAVDHFGEERRRLVLRRKQRLRDMMSMG